MVRKLRGKGRPPGAPASQPQGARPQQGGGGWAPLRDAVRRDIEQAASALGFAAALHERLESQRRLFADFPRVMEQLRSGALERVSSALARLFEGKEQFDLMRFLRDLPLALGQLAAAEAARRGVPKEAPSPDQAAASAPPPPVEPVAEGAAVESSAQARAEEVGPEASTADSTEASTSTAPSNATSIPNFASTPTPTSIATPTGTSSLTTQANAAASGREAPSSASTSANGEPAAVEPPSPRLEFRARLLAASPQLGKAVMTYRRTVATVRRAAAPRRAPGPWRSDHEVLEEAKRAVDFARQLYDAYAEAWADQPTQPGSGEAMSAETDRFLAWTQLARYMDVAAPRSQPPPAEKQPPAEKLPPAAEKQPVTQGSPGAGATPAEGEHAHGA